MNNIFRDANRTEGGGMSEPETSGYCEYCTNNQEWKAHLAALAVAESKIELLRKSNEAKREKIASLTARCESLDRVVGECGQRELELEARIKELEAVVASLQMLTEPKQR
jgi:chromosome segregation ATPase